MRDRWAIRRPTASTGAVTSSVEPGKRIDPIEAFLEKPLNGLTVIDRLRRKACFDELRLGGASEVEHRRIKGDRRHQQSQRHHREPEGLRAMPIARFEPAGIRDQGDDDCQRDERAAGALPPDRNCHMTSGSAHSRYRGRAEPPVVPRHRPWDERGSQDQHPASERRRVPHDQSDLKRQPRGAPWVQRVVEQIERRIGDRVLKEALIDDQHERDRRARSELCHGEQRDRVGL